MPANCARTGCPSPVRERNDRLQANTRQRHGAVLLGWTPSQRRIIIDNCIRNGTMALLSCQQVARSFYGVQALCGVDLQVEPRRITGLIGPNGAGKTTLFNCISGLVPADAGRIIFNGHDITRWRPDRISELGLIRTFQLARGIPRLSVLENLLLYGAHQPGESLGTALVRTQAMLAR